jgi:hypothetical protein
MLIYDFLKIEDDPFKDENGNIYCIGTYFSDNEYAPQIEFTMGIDYLSISVAKLNLGSIGLKNMLENSNDLIGIMHGITSALNSLLLSHRKMLEEIRDHYKSIRNLISNSKDKVTNTIKIDSITEPVYVIKQIERNITDSTKDATSVSLKCFSLDDVEEEEKVFELLLPNDFLRTLKEGDKAYIINGSIDIVQSNKVN